MSARADKKRSVLSTLLMIAAGILAVGICGFLFVYGIPEPYIPRKEPIDTSAMGEETPLKIVTLNANISDISSDENYEIAYLLGNKGNLYVLCRDAEEYYVTLWHPEFWKDVEVVDICAESSCNYAAALDRNGNVYVWEKEKISRLENIPKVTEIYAAYRKFAIVTDEETICMWSPKENANPDMENMEVIDMETPIGNIASAGEDVFILDANHVLWSVESGTKSIVKENVKSIMQGHKGLAIRMMDNENELYIYNIDLFLHHYETVTFADKYEVSRIVLTDNISSISLNANVGVACTDKGEVYRWGWREPTKYAHVAVPAVTVYEEPVKVDVTDVKYHMVIGKYFIYMNEDDEVFVWI
ncbi:MAG: hypothetical protein NC231_14305 [Bacillus sp. (in: Bacteria)]|nr:hypothetical protein [Bacillus sp. (in: firmicutes)]MCM1427702.1 hypothetical protein [Eubacterium sp.]